MHDYCGCTKPEPLEEIKNLQVGDTATCKNCGHLIYFQYPGQWEHYTRAYRPHGLPYTSLMCYAENEEVQGDVPGD